MAIVCLSVAIGFLLGQERVIGWEMQAGKEFLTMFLKISQRLAEFSRKIGESLWRYRNIARHSLHLHCHSNPNIILCVYSKRTRERTAVKFDGAM